MSAFWKTEPVKWLDLSADIKYADSYRSYVSDDGIREGLSGNAVQMPSYTVVDPAVVDGIEYHGRL